MKIWVLSDIHHDLSRGWTFPSREEQPDFDVLVIAGDLMPRMERGVEWLQRRVTDKPVIYIAGNHEGYGCDIDRTREKAKGAAADTNIAVMENESLVINGVRFLAGTLWTDFELFGRPDVAMLVAAEQMNDYRLIRKDNYAHRLRPIDTAARHRATRRFIEAELAKPFAGPTVIVTHHGPYRGAIKQGHEQDTLSAAYVSDLTKVIERFQPNLWIYGHTHRSDDTRLGNTRVISNAKGYGPRLPGGHWENPLFDPTFTIEIGGAAR
jgi:Icc-related predicted phosphoesterase